MMGSEPSSTARPDGAVDDDHDHDEVDELADLEAMWDTEAANYSPPPSVAAALREQVSRVPSNVVKRYVPHDPYAVSSLDTACKYGSPEDVAHWLAKTVEKENTGMTRNKVTVEEVVRRGGRGWTPLMTSAAADNVRAFRYLWTTYGAPTDEAKRVVDVAGSPVVLPVSPRVFMEACRGGADQVVACIVDELCEGNPHAVDGLSRTKARFSQASPLHLAVASGNRRLVQRLLETGLFVPHRDVKSDGTSALMSMFESDFYYELLERVLERSKPPSLETANKKGFTCMHFAARRGAVNNCRLLLENGVNPNTNEPAVGVPTPVFLAAENNHSEVIRVLVDGGADMDAVHPPMVDGDWMMTPVIAAARMGADSALRTLLHLGASVAPGQPGGANCLHYAAMNARFDTISMLVRDDRVRRLLDDRVQDAERSRCCAGCFAASRSNYRELRLLVKEGMSLCDKLERLNRPSEYMSSAHAAVREGKQARLMMLASRELFNETFVLPPVLAEIVLSYL